MSRFMYGGKLQKVKSKYRGEQVEASRDRRPAAKALDEEDGVYTITAGGVWKGNRYMDQEPRRQDYRGETGVRWERPQENDSRSLSQA